MYMLRNELQVPVAYKLKYSIANKYGAKNIIYFYWSLTK